ncbi:hypothetical protein PIB30_056594 [Stylosanthes scabra]|uniref:Cyclic nucleotide-binding domain-containing protein n=1 Tax=Stylosanthes scabra TaxID=79078 RepID=A0ABU6TLJ0_9FABA|nr:hypothetical protein [Stylosanthes scabra]
MSKPILDAICAKLKWKMYLPRSKVMYPGDLINMMIFIVHGRVEIKDSGGIRFYISHGDTYGEELLLWCLRRSLRGISTGVGGSKVKTVMEAVGRQRKGGTASEGWQQQWQDERDGNGWGLWTEKWEESKVAVRLCRY